LTRISFIIIFFLFDLFYLIFISFHFCVEMTSTLGSDESAFCQKQFPFWKNVDFSPRLAFLCVSFVASAAAILFSWHQRNARKNEIMKGRDTAEKKEEEKEFLGENKKTYIYLIFR